MRPPGVGRKDFAPRVSEKWILARGEKRGCAAKRRAPLLAPIKNNAHGAVCDVRAVTRRCNTANKLDRIQQRDTMESMILLRTIPHTNGAVTIEQHVTPQSLMAALQAHLERGRWVSLASPTGMPVKLPERVPERSILRGAGRAHLTPIRP